MDHFVLGKRHGRVACEIIEADMNGNPPNVDGFDESGQSLLDVIVERNDKVWILDCTSECSNVIKNLLYIVLCLQYKSMLRFDH